MPITFNHSGKNGANGHNGSHGSSGSSGYGRGGNGGHGHHGTPGQHGTSATPISVVFTTDGSKFKALEASGSTKYSYHSDVQKITLLTNGGHGGHGGHGGAGGAGGRGADGRNADRYSHGTNGHDGGNGGDGGNGKDGGNAGDAKPIVVFVDENNLDMTYLVTHSQQGGTGGNAGRGGSGGSGGAGGRKGSDYTWTTSSTDHEGNTRTTRHHNPGGSYNGSNGSSGSSGYNGKRGSNGKDATFYYYVVPSEYIPQITKAITAKQSLTQFQNLGLKTSHSFHLCTYKIFDVKNTEGNTVFEYNDNIVLKAIFINQSTMPTPNNGVNIYINDNDGISGTNKQHLAHSLAMNQTTEFDFTGQVLQNLKKKKDNDSTIVTIKMSGYHKRINVVESNLQNVSYKITVQHPVKLNFGVDPEKRILLSGTKSKLLTFDVKSLIDLSPDGRIANFIVRFSGHLHVIFKDSDNQAYFEKHQKRDAYNNTFVSFPLTMTKNTTETYIVEVVVDSHAPFNQNFDLETSITYKQKSGTLVEPVHNNYTIRRYREYTGHNDGKVIVLTNEYTKEDDIVETSCQHEMMNMGTIDFLNVYALRDESKSESSYKYKLENILSQHRNKYICDIQPNKNVMSNQLLNHMISFYNIRYINFKMSSNPTAMTYLTNDQCYLTYPSVSSNCLVEHYGVAYQNKDDEPSKKFLKMIKKKNNEFELNPHTAVKITTSRFWFCGFCRVNLEKKARQMVKSYRKRHPTHDVYYLIKADHPKKATIYIYRIGNIDDVYFNVQDGKIDNINLSYFLNFKETMELYTKTDFDDVKKLAYDNICRIIMKEQALVRDYFLGINYRKFSYPFLSQLIHDYGSVDINGIPMTEFIRIFIEELPKGFDFHFDGKKPKRIGRHHQNVSKFMMKWYKKQMKMVESNKKPKNVEKTKLIKKSETTVKPVSSNYSGYFGATSSVQI